MTGAVTIAQLMHVEFVRSYGGCWATGVKLLINRELGLDLIRDGFAKHLPSQFDPPEPPPKPQFMPRKRKK
jgi:hypothetical protein